ncbi:MAG: heme-binding domain-containing protein [Ignavibacteriales bacterium]
MAVSRKKKIGIWIASGIIILLLVIQLIPVDHSTGNNIVINEPKWDSERTREYAKRACFDCHSNQTKWPGYSYIAPVSWFVTDHVHEGKRKLNFSEWKYTPKKAKRIISEIKRGEMPLKSYLLLHPEARLTDTEKQEFISGLGKTLNINPDSIASKK